MDARGQSDLTPMERRESITDKIINIPLEWEFIIEAVKQLTPKGKGTAYANFVGEINRKRYTTHRTSW